MRSNLYYTTNGQQVMQVLSGKGNVYMIVNGDYCALIDTGPAFMKKTLQKRIDKMGVSKVDFLILTHTHFDHAANSNYLKNKYNLKVLVHKAEKEFLSTGENVRLKGTNAFAKILIRFFGELFLSRVNYQPCASDMEIEDNSDSIKDKLNSIIIHTPGHTSGSVSIIVDNEIALVGDAMIGVFKRSILPPFANDIALLTKSWQRLLGSGCKIFLAGHGIPIKRQLVESEYLKLKEMIE